MGKPIHNLLPQGEPFTDVASALRASGLDWTVQKRSVYAAVPASLVGREQEIEVGPMSGKSNVIFWLESRGLPATDEIVDRIFAAAKASNRMLTHEKIQTIIGGDVKIKPSGIEHKPERRHGF